METAWWAPGRINLIGEHTDYNGGLVLPFAVPWGVTARVAGRPDGTVRVSSAQRPGREVTVPLEELRPGTPDGWASYAAGVLWALRRAGHPVGGVSIRLDSDLPEGAGLSSSAALECAVAAALDDLWALGLTRVELARVAQRAENDFAGAPTGILDQSAAMLARAGHAVLIDTRDLASTLVPFDLAAAGLRLLIADTGVAHEHRTGGYRARREECERAARALGVPVLGDAPPGARTGDPVLDRRIRHVRTENARVRETVDLLAGGRVRAIGPLLTASHASLRDDYEVSWPEADLAVERALAAGALGARMVGGGFGGSVIALVEEAASTTVRTSVEAAFKAEGHGAPRFLSATPAPGAHRLNEGR
ncbi:galactokinase [Actinomadura viridis]|uniref:galactokinase n=1 Tax=Actinomadura viridis TaxID=58110 RepID=UPI0027DE1D55|nr:galactokinase [Actinomadura viridis]